MSVQTMSPRPGSTRNDPPSSSPPPSAAARIRMFARSVTFGLEEERDQAEDERVEHDRLGEREAQPLDRGDLVTHLGLAGHRLDDLAEDVADADADRKSTRLNSSHANISYAVFCLKKKKNKIEHIAIVAH